MGKLIPTIIMPLEDYQKMQQVVRAVAAGYCLTLNSDTHLLDPQGDAREVWQTAFEVSQLYTGEDK